MVTLICYGKLGILIYLAGLMRQKLGCDEVASIVSYGSRLLIDSYGGRVAFY